MPSTLLHDVKLSAMGPKRGNPIAWGRPSATECCRHTQNVSQCFSWEPKGICWQMGNCPQSSLLHSCYTKQQRISIEAAKSQWLLLYSYTSKFFHKQHFSKDLQKVSYIHVLCCIFSVEECVYIWTELRGLNNDMTFLVFLWNLILRGAVSLFPTLSRW